MPDQVIMHTEEAERLIAHLRKLKEILESQTGIIQLRPKYLPTKSAHFQGDYDFIVQPKEIETVIATVYEESKKAGINFRLKQTKWSKKRVEFFISEDTQPLILEFWIAVECTDKGRPAILPGQSIYALWKEKPQEKEAIFSLIYISHLWHKRKDAFSEENQYRIAYFLDKLQLEAGLMKEKATSLLEKIQSKEISLADASAQALETLKNKGLSTLIVRLPRMRLLTNKISRLLINKRKFVPIVGPDGVGKGIVSERVLEELTSWRSFRFKALYRIRILYKPLMFFMRKKPGQALNQIDESISYYIFFVSWISIWTLHFIFPFRYVLLDRYYTDYFGTPLRYLSESRKPQRLKHYTLLQFLTYTPQKMIFMACTDRSLKERKDELPQVSVDFMQDIYVDFILKKKIPEILFVSTENAVEVSVTAVKRYLKS